MTDNDLPQLLAVIDFNSLITDTSVQQSLIEAGHNVEHRVAKTSNRSDAHAARTYANRIARVLFRRESRWLFTLPAGASGY